MTQHVYYAKTAKRQSIISFLNVNILRKYGGDTEKAKIQKTSKGMGVRSNMDHKSEQEEEVIT